MALMILIPLYMLYLYNLNVASYTMDELLLNLCSRKYVPSFVGISNSDANDIVPYQLELSRPDIRCELVRPEC